MAGGLLTICFVGSKDYTDVRVQNRQTAKLLWPSYLLIASAGQGLSDATIGQHYATRICLSACITLQATDRLSLLVCANLVSLDGAQNGQPTVCVERIDPCSFRLRLFNYPRLIVTIYRIDVRRAAVGPQCLAPTSET